MMNGRNGKTKNNQARIWTSSGSGGSFVFSKKKGVPIISPAIKFVILFFSLIGAFIIWKISYAPQIDKSEIEESAKTENKFEKIVEAIIPARKSNNQEENQRWFVPGPISISAMKKKGCVADGLLSGYGDDTKESVEMIKRSECVYLHRALESWAEPPDFDKASKIMQKINKPGLIYGMFLSEALKKGADTNYEGDGRKFNFTEMCREDSDDMWGYRTCKANLESPEYRRYLRYVTSRAMDIGIQSFLFGQIYYQDNPDLTKTEMKEIIDDMKAYAKERGMEIVIGAQTGDITDENYLRMFDYIEGGVGMGDDGWVENGPCWSRKSTCWALLWHDRYAKKANNVFLHLDWSGLSFDDMSSFARMDKNKRAETLKRLYNYFTSKNMGFLMPMMATINRENDGCYGPKKRFYSASKEYSCKDENAINAIIKGAK